MDQLINKLKVPFIIVVILGIAVILIQVSNAYNNYWQGRLAKAKLSIDN